MIKNSYITEIEKNTGKIFSEISIPEIEFNDQDYVKLKLEYSKTVYGNEFSDYLIYKAEIPFYLCLERLENKKYICTCYFEINDLTKVKFFLNSLIKKQKK